MSKQSRLLAVDASILAGANRSSGACARTLEDIMKICHRVLVNPDVLAEWTKHQTEYARKWRAMMNGKKKLVPVVANSTAVEAEIQAKVPPQNTAEKRALLKDAHLLAVALAGDRVLLTADLRLADLCEKHEVQTGRIEWLKLNPSNTVAQNQTIANRLRDLTTTRPSPPLPAKT